MAEKTPPTRTRNSRDASTKRNDRKARLFETSPPLLSVLGMAAIWVFLWGDLSWGNVIAGLFLGLVVTMLTPMPPSIRRGLAFRPTAVLRLGVLFLRDVVHAALQISWMALKGQQPSGGVIRVHLHAHSDQILTITAGMVSLVPGTIVVDVHRLTGTLYLHVFDEEMSKGFDAAHHAAVAQEERILRAFGTKNELIDAGYVPGASPRLGRLTPEQHAALIAERGGDS